MPSSSSQLKPTCMLGHLCGNETSCALCGGVCKKRPLAPQPVGWGASGDGAAHKKGGGRKYKKSLKRKTKKRKYKKLHKKKKRKSKTRKSRLK